MAWSDVLPVIENLAPVIATAVGTPLLGGAVAALESVFGLTPAPTATISQRQDAVASAVQGATPEQLASVRKADQDYAARMAEAGFANQEAIATLAVSEAKLYVDDTADARRANSSNERVFWLGIVILLTFAFIMASSLVGAYLLMTGTLPVANAAVVGMVAGFVGTVIGYTGALAQSVTSFFFGSSKGSETKSDQMATAFSQAMAQPVVVTPTQPVATASPKA